MKNLVRGLVVLVVLGVAALAGVLYLSKAVEPQSAPVAKTIPNDNFTR